MKMSKAFKISVKMAE